MPKLAAKKLLNAALLVAALATLPASATTTAGFVDIEGGGRLFYQETGDGEPLVLLHDGLLPSVSWDEQFAAFARYYRVIRYDRRGYGGSSAADPDASPVEDLRALLDARKVARAVVIGCSSGGGLAADFALAHPQRVSALVLAGPVFSGFPFSEHFQARGARHFRSVFTGGDKKLAVQAWAADRYLVDPANTAARERLRVLLERHPAIAEGARPAAREPERPAAGRLAEIGAPTLLITGAGDVPDVHAQIGAFAAAVPTAARHLIEDAGHLAHLEKSEAWNRVVLDFLAPPAYAADRLAALRALSPADRQAFADDGAPLDVKEVGRERRRGPGGGAHAVVDLTYAGQAGPVPAYLVLPGGATAKKSAAAVLFLHHGQGNRSTFLEEALELADRGVVSLSIDGPDNRPGQPPPPDLPWVPERERRDIVQTVVDLRRGLDLLAQRPEVDEDRLGYVGYSLGSTMGARLIGVDHRPRAAVLIAGYPALTFALTDGHHRFDVFFRELLEPSARESYLAAVRPLDGIHFLGRQGSMAVQLQFAEGDEFISTIDAAIYRAALPDALAQVYPGSHFQLGDGQPRADRLGFLLRQLGVAP